MLESLPNSIGEMKDLEQLILHNCRELRTVNALPHSLRHLDLGNCRRLDHVPSFEGLTTLATLILCYCTQLKEIQGLDCLTTLEEVDLTGCTSMQPGTLQLQHNRAMQSCYLSGSNVSVKYDNDWSKSEPALQLIIYSDNVFGIIDDWMEELYFNQEKVWMEATFVGENKCVAVVICCMAIPYGGDNIGFMGLLLSKAWCLDALIVREGEEVF